MSAKSVWQTQSRKTRVTHSLQGASHGAMFDARDQAVTNTEFLPSLFRIVVGMLVVMLAAAGCQERLAQRDAYFVPLRGSSASPDSEAEYLVSYHRALQAARLRCTERTQDVASPSDSTLNTARPALTQGQEAQSQLCTSSTVTHAAHGGPLNSYRRWVEDRVRPLPKPSETASSIGGGS